MKSIVSLHGGEIKVKSEEEDKTCLVSALLSKDTIRVEFFSLFKRFQAVECSSDT